MLLIRNIFTIFPRFFHPSDLCDTGEARVDLIGRNVDPANQTVLVRTEVKGADTCLRPGQFVEVRLQLSVPVRIADVADVRVGAITRYGAVTRNGEDEAVEGLVLGLRGANARQVVEGVRARLAELQSALPEGVTVDVFYDRGNLVSLGGLAIAIGKVSHQEPILIRLLHRLYEPVLAWSLRHAAVVVTTALALLAATVFVFGFIGKTLMPMMDEGDVIVQLEKLPCAATWPSRPSLRPDRVS